MNTQTAYTQGEVISALAVARTMLTKSTNRDMQVKGHFALLHINSICPQGKLFVTVTIEQQRAMIWALQINSNPGHDADSIKSALRDIRAEMNIRL